ncbi:MAG: 50S ribosomal protein L25/general stress protein Ctc, partial [Rhodospirillales bacterium]
MPEAVVLQAEARDRAGKGAARATRRAGRVPAVIYGNKQTPLMLSLDPVELQQQLNRPGFFAHIFELKVNGDAHRVLARDVQFDPVTDRALHVDFMRFSANTRIEVAVAVHFLNEEASPGLKTGGVLNIVRHEVELDCSPENIPEFLTVDLTGLEIGDSVHISSVTLPEGVRPTITDRDFTVATIAAPTVMTAEDEAAEGAEAAEEGAAAEKKDEGEEGEKADS